MKKQLIICGLSLISFEALAQFSVTNSFTSTSVISSSQMNTNFDDIEAQINALWGAGSITTSQLANGSVTAAKIASMGATTNQVLTYTGSTWTPMTPSMIDSTKLPLAGGTMSGVLNMGTNKIMNLGAPSSSTDAATKTYVDSTISGQVSSLSATNIISGTLAPARGGTGMTSISANKFVITNTIASAMTEVTCSPGMAVGFNGTTPGCVEAGKWTSGANGIEYNTGLNVGIGIGAVNTNKLHIVTNGGTSNGIVLNASAAGSGMLMGLHDQGTARFLVTQNGLVGMGTGTPAYPLEVVQNSPGTQPYVTLKNNYGTPGVGDGAGLRFQIGNSGANAHIEGRFESTPSTNSSSLSFHTSTSGSMTQKMVIMPSGTVGIGTTTPSGSYKLVVNGIIAPSVDNTHTLGDSAYRFSQVYAVNGTINTSDLREKKEILESDLGLDFINRLQPVSYRWKKGDTDVHYGFIAQDVEKVLNEMVKKKQQTSIISHDKKSDKYGMRYSELISPLVKAVKELDHKIITQNLQPRLPASTGMENKVKELEAENKALKAYLCGKDPSAPFCKR
jgi:hypothetical protein